MTAKRVIARLDIKNASVVKGIQLEGLRKVGSPFELAHSYTLGGADELVLTDIVASLYDRTGFLDIIGKIATNQKIPICVIGGIRNLDDVKRAFDHGADKIGINTGGIANPMIYEQASARYGSQAIVASIEAKFDSQLKTWHAMINTGRDRSGIFVPDLVERLETLGCGEILITSVDCDGLKNGPDIPLIEKIREKTSLPIIYSGGIRSPKSALIAFQTGVDAVCLNSLIHYNEESILSCKKFLSDSQQEIRMDCYE